MAESGRKRGRGADPAKTRAELIDAAFVTLREDGFRGATARAIAARAACNQAAIYYHFDGIDNLLLTSLRVSSEARLERYREDLKEPMPLPDLVGRLQRLHREDRDLGHLSVLAELVGGITASPELRSGIDEATAPWLEFVESKIADAAADLPFAQALPTSDLADVVFSLMLGIELRNKIDGRDDRGERLFRLARMAALVVPTVDG